MLWELDFLGTNPKYLTLRLMTLDARGERSFSFARKPGADTQITPEELDRDLIANCGIFHFGSLSLTDEPVRSATEAAVKLAKASGAIIAYDPNYRPLLWESRDQAMEQMRRPLSTVDLLKVSDDEIASAVLLLLERCKQVVETSGAAPLAAVLNNKVDVKGKKVVCVLSGGNIDVSFIHKIVEKGLITRCRQLKFSVLMPDAPGALERFSHIVAQQNANIILFQHDRVQTDLEIGEAIIHVVCEVGGVDHAKRLIDTLGREGYRVFTSQI